jgi:ureidoglycolate lyase
MAGVNATGPRSLALEPVTREAFAPFGELIEAGTGPGREANLGTALRFDHAATLQSTREHAQANLALYRSRPQALPFEVTLFERHPASSQVFAPLRAGRWLVIVAPDDPAGAPDTARARAFVCGPGVAINFRRGVWHHPIVVLDEPAALLMLAWEDGSGEDCEELRLPRPLVVR